MAEQFELDISKWVQKSKGRLRRFQFGFAQNLFINILQNHPVQTGFLRSSWNIGLNKINTAQNGTKGTISAPAALPDAAISVALLPVLTTDVYEINMTNTANYAYFVEFGTAKMAPRAFVRQAIAKADRIAQQTLAELGQ